MATKQESARNETHATAQVVSTGNVVTGDRNNAANSTVNINAPKSGMIATIVIPLVAAFVGAYANHQFSLQRAPTRIAEQVDTFLGLANKALESSKSSGPTSPIVPKLEELVTEARAIQSNLALMAHKEGAVSFQPDFWLPPSKGVLLGGVLSLGITNVYSAGRGVQVILGDKWHDLQAGMRLPVKLAANRTCFLLYMGTSADGKLHGFKLVCDAS
jgi:hypothetical protein